MTRGPWRHWEDESLDAVTLRGPPPDVAREPVENHLPKGRFELKDGEQVLLVRELGRFRVEVGVPGIKAEHWPLTGGEGARFVRSPRRAHLLGCAARASIGLPAGASVVARMAAEAKLARRADVPFWRRWR